MIRKIHATISYLRLSDHMNLFVERRINPEIYFPAEALDNIKHAELKKQAALLNEAGLAITVHAAHIDLNPGSLDSVIREATRRRFEEVFRAAEILRPSVIVFHPGYDELRYGDYRAAWLENSVRFWHEMIPRAKSIGCMIAVENIFEREPSTLAALMKAVDDPGFRHCFDAGHWNMFKTVSMEEWFSVLGEFVSEAHIHDNHGVTDEHLPLGEGQIDFDLLFAQLDRFAPEAVWTIEAHSPERMERALNNIQKYI